MSPHGTASIDCGYEHTYFPHLLSLMNCLSFLGTFISSLLGTFFCI
jgi:hypothetical protein